jgi:hypothetical protein
MSKVSSTEIINQHYVRNYEQTRYHRNLDKLESENQKKIQEESRVLINRRLQIEVEKIRQYEKLHEKKLYEVLQKGCNIDAYI